MSTKEDTAKTCPQCEGAGQEEIGALPVVCRKCGGSGNVPTMRRIAAVMCGGEALEKTAQGDLDIPDLTGDQDEGDDAEDQGSGFDEMSVVPKDKSDRTLKLEIATALGQLSESNQAKLFDRIIVVFGATAAEVQRTVAGSDGQPNAGKIEKYLYCSLERMNRAQLCSTLCEVRKFM